MVSLIFFMKKGADMKAVKRLNNNVVVCTDRKGRELIAIGKGIGFGEMPKDISINDIERTFYDMKYC